MEFVPAVVITAVLIGVTILLIDALRIRAICPYPGVVWELRNYREQRWTYPELPNEGDIIQYADGTWTRVRRVTKWRISLANTMDMRTF